MSDSPLDKVEDLLADFKTSLPLGLQVRRKGSDVFTAPMHLERACKFLEQRAAASPFHQRPDRRAETLQMVLAIHARKRPASDIGHGERRVLPWILSGQDPELAESPVFLTAMKLLGTDTLRPGQLMGLVETFLEAADIPDTNYEPWVSRIHRELGRYGGSLEQLARWREHRRLLFTPESPKLVAKHLLDHSKGASVAFDALGLRRASAFGSRILVAFTRLLTEPSTFPARVEEFPRLVSIGHAGGGADDQFLADAVRRCIEKLLLAYHAHPATILHDGLGRLIFSRLGDPRQTRNPRWGGIDERAVTVYRRWVARADLELFFRAVAMDEDRRAFWLSYVDMMENSRVALGNAALFVNQTAVSQFLQDGRASRLGGGNGQVSAFMFQIGGYHFVEFSETGNACYLYRADRSPVSFDQAWYGISDLKREIKRWIQWADTRQIISNRLLHHSGWEVKARNLLRALGIRPVRQERYQ
jgi:hypothetical protein